jgi:hypothetical protein
MKNFLHCIFCYRTIKVTDAITGQKEKATYIMLFGLLLTIIYKAT